MAKIVTVRMNGEVLEVSPPSITLEGGVENMVVNNETDVELDWSVPKGAFTSVTRFEKNVKRKQAKESPTARRHDDRTEYTYAVVEKRKLSGKKRRRAKGRGTTADPVLIID